MRFLGAALVSGILLVLPLSSEKEESFPAVSWAQASAEECILFCDDAGVSLDCVPGPNEHYAAREGDSHEYGAGWHYDCYPGNCDETHPLCEPTLAALEDLQ